MLSLKTVVLRRVGPIHDSYNLSFCNPSPLLQTGAKFLAFVRFSQIWIRELGRLGEDKCNRALLFRVIAQFPGSKTISQELASHTKEVSSFRTLEP